jgi:hypothetical protein
MLKAWMRERHGRPDDLLFVSIRGGKLSRDAVESLVEKYISSPQKNADPLSGRT